MNAIQQFNALNGTTVSRPELENIITTAKQENATDVVYRLSKILNENPDEQRFTMIIKQYPQSQGLAGARHTGNYREALDECGRLKKGWKFVGGNVVKIAKKEKSKKKTPVVAHDKKYKFVLYKTQTSNQYTLAFSFDELKDKNIFDFRKTHKSSGLNEYFVINKAILSEKYKNDVDFYTLSADEFKKKNFNLLLVEKNENQKDKGDKNEKDKKQVKKADKETEKIFVKLLLPLYVERKNNPRKFTGHNDDSPENFRIEDTDFWAKFTDINTDLFKTKASKKLVKITEKGFEVLEKHTKKSEQTEENIIEKALEKEPQGTRLLLEDTAKKFKISIKEAYAFYDRYRYTKNLEEYAISERNMPFFELFFGKKLNQRFFSSVKKLSSWQYFKNNDFSREIIEYIDKRRKWNKYKKYGLSAPQLSLTTDDFKKMSVPELRAFTLQYYLTHLKGKKVALKNFIKEVVFTTKAGRKIAHGEAMYKEKAVVIEHLEELIKNSTYNNWGDRKPNDHKEILGYLNFKSKLTIDGEKRHIRISFIFNKDRELKLKSYDVGKKKSGKVSQGVLPSAEETLPLSDRKITKNSETTQEKAEKNILNAPLTDEIRKKAFTEKGKLRKGWYYEENGFLTNGKEFYIKDLEYAEEYNAIKTKIAQRNDPKNKELWDLYKQKTDEENQDYRKQRVLIIDELSSKYDVKNKQDFNYFLNKFILKDELRKFSYIDKGEENKRMKFFKDLAKPIDKDKYTFTYSLTPKGEEVISEYLEKVKELFIKMHGNPKKINKKYGLSAPSSPTPPKEGLTPLSLGEAVSESEEVVGVRNLAQKMASRPTQWEFFQIDNPQMANFLGKVEKKSKDSVVITLTGGQGSGKTRFAFQFINDLAQNYKVGHISNEEQPDSSLYYDKVQQYLNQNALQNVEPYDVRSLEELNEVIQRNEIIVIDSFQKIKELDPKFEVDKDLRKKYNGKLFLVIFQQTSDGKMRGGSKSQFDGDIILFTEKFDDYRENYVYPDKNRYNSVPANELKYSIFEQRLLPVENPQISENQSVENLTFDIIM